MKVIYFNKKIYELKSLDLDDPHGLTACDISCNACDLDHECGSDYNICIILNRRFGYSIHPNSTIREIHLFELIKRFMV